jgi:phenylalanyl-tRNA synthetase alpha chain
VTSSDPSPEAGAELSLSAPERAVLLALRAASDPLEEPAIAAFTGLPPETVRGSVQRLRSKHLALVDERHREWAVLTGRGEKTLAAGLPERRLLDRLVQHPEGVSPESLKPSEGFEDEERSVAIGVLRRRGYLEPGSTLRLRSGSEPPSTRLPEEEAVRAIAEGQEAEASLGKVLERRGLVERRHATDRRWSASPEGRALPISAEDRPLLGALTAAAIRDGTWRTADFRPYDVRADVPYRTGPEPHPYARFLEEFQEILIGLGFSEADGPLVETEFWNADALYMPQEHPARSVHDVFLVDGPPGAAPPADLLARVAAVHAGTPIPGESDPVSIGWRVPYRPEIARRLVLRSQTTAVSARFLAQRPKPPFRMYALDRNFRPDSLDATHHIEFQQCEGVLGEEGITLRDLIGIFHELAEAIGIRELKVRPSYFPFTEPSIEGYVRHPRLGWIEIFPGGMLRPEVLRPLGIEVPVAAWGIGVTRLALIALKINDIRDLYLDDVNRLTGGASA